MDGSTNADGNMGPPIDGGVIFVDGGFDDMGRPIDGGIIFVDGGFEDSGSTNGDGSTSGLDGQVTDGSPLSQPLAEFCAGSGAVIDVGGGSVCTGNIAQDTFRFALCTCETAMTQSQLLLDAFDSTKGLYGAPLPGGGVNIKNDGHLGVNQSFIMNGGLTVKGSAFVAGAGGFSVGPSSSIALDLESGGTAVQTRGSGTVVDRNAFINGDVTGHYAITGNLTVPVGATVDPATTYGALMRGPVSIRPPCPCEASEILNIAALTSWAATHNDDAALHVITATTWANGGPDSVNLPCGRYYLTQIEHTGTLTINAEGRTVLFVDGDMNINGSFNLALTSSKSEVDLFVRGDLSIKASASLGSATAPSKVRTYVGGTSTITLSASTLFGGNVYAPNAPVVFGASAELYGSLFAKNVQFSGNTSIHFDSAIRNAGQQCQPDAGMGDGGTPRDGSVSGDASTTNDGSTANDGAAGDATGTDGTVGTDGGTANDGGTVNDSGTPDTGVRPDSGVPPDSGVVGCNGCFQCPNNLACVIPSGQSTGTCAGCTSDLECCAPDICLSGRCQPAL
jgi:hypothetical protein